MEELFSARGIDPARVQARLEKAAGEVCLPFGKRGKTYNSRLAQELGKWAESRGKGDAFHDAAFRACLVDGENISMGSVLAGLAGSLGLPVNEAEEVLETRAFKEHVDLDWARSRTMRIKVAPTMIINEKMLVGAQKYNKMERFLRENDVRERNVSA
jgi:predicted DsbA family dithiol-disulfide isomerase